LLAHIEDSSGGGNVAQNVAMHIPQAPTATAIFTGKVVPGTSEILPLNDSESESDLSELSDGSLSDCSANSDDSGADFQAMTPAEQAEHEGFGHEYKGPSLSDDHASRLLVLMAHASTCPCR